MSDFPLTVVRKPFSNSSQGKYFTFSLCATQNKRTPPGEIVAELHKTKVRALFLIIIGLSAVPLAHGSTDFRCRDWRKLKSKSQRDRASLYIDGLWVGMNTSPLFESGCEGIREKLKLPRGKDIPDLVNEVFKICDLEKYSNLIVPPLIKPALMRLTGKQKEADFELQLQVDTAKDFPQTK